MKRIVLVVAVCLLMAPAVVRAENAAKFGYVNMQMVLNSVDEGKTAMKQLQTEFDARQKELATIKSDIDKMKADLAKQRLILSGDALKEKEEVFQKKVYDAQSKLNNYQMELQSKQSEVTGRILGQIKDVVAQLGKDEGYTMILEKSQDVVLYSPEDADLTSRIIEMYNKRSKKGK